MAIKREPHSDRQDRDVPAFPHDKPIIVFDGHRALCSNRARFVIRHDAEGRCRLLPAQSPLGQALDRRYGLSTSDFETHLPLRDGRAFDGSIRMIQALGRPWSAVARLGMLPARWGEAPYSIVARNRLRWSGRRDVGHRPDPADHHRFLA